MPCVTCEWTRHQGSIWFAQKYHAITITPGGGLSQDLSTCVSDSNHHSFQYPHFNLYHLVYPQLGLILNDVYPFKSEDYTSYRSAGFRGQLGKGFHTVNGLTHVFVHGVPLEPIPDLE